MWNARTGHYTNTARRFFHAQFHAGRYARHRSKGSTSSASKRSAPRLLSSIRTTSGCVPVRLIHDLGGIHKFCAWKGPILSDSGGYQVFSLRGMRTMSEEGVEFRSHLDGSKQFLTPERSVQIQEPWESISQWRSTSVRRRIFRKQKLPVLST